MRREGAYGPASQLDLPLWKGVMETSPYYRLCPRKESESLYRSPPPPQGVDLASALRHQEGLHHSEVGASRHPKARSADSLLHDPLVGGDLSQTGLEPVTTTEDLKQSKDSGSLPRLPKPLDGTNGPAHPMSQPERHLSL